MIYLNSSASCARLTQASNQRGRVGKIRERKDCRGMLTFNVKKEWFEKIKSGEKTHEYREYKPYWRNLNL